MIKIIVFLDANEGWFCKAMLDKSNTR